MNDPNLTPASATTFNYLNSYSTFDSAQQEGGGTVLLIRALTKHFLFPNFLIETCQWLYKPLLRVIRP